MVLPAYRYLGDDLAQVDVEGLRITQTRYAADQAQPWHAHENPNFHFLLAGAFRDESRDLGEQMPERFSLVFHPAGSVHRTFAGPQGRRGLNVEPSAEWLARYGLTDRDLGRYRVRQDARASLTLLGFALGALPSGALSDAAFESVLIEDGEEETSSWLRRLEGCLQADEHWTLTSLARELGVHPVYLARVFRGRYGTALTPYLHRRRLLTALRDLEAGDGLTEVALAAGFADHAHLSRSFRAFFGLTPSSVRERLKQVSILQA